MLPFQPYESPFRSPSDLKFPDFQLFQLFSTFFDFFQLLRFLTIFDDFSNFRIFRSSNFRESWFWGPREPSQRPFWGQIPIPGPENDPFWPKMSQIGGPHRIRQRSPQRGPKSTFLGSGCRVPKTQLPSYAGEKIRVWCSSRYPTRERPFFRGQIFGEKNWSLQNFSKIPRKWRFTRV